MDPRQPEMVFFSLLINHRLRKRKCSAREREGEQNYLHDQFMQLARFLIVTYLWCSGKCTSSLLSCGYRQTRKHVWKNFCLFLFRKKKIYCHVKNLDRKTNWLPLRDVYATSLSNSTRHSTEDTVEAKILLGLVFVARICHIGGDLRI